MSESVVVMRSTSNIPSKEDGGGDVEEVKGKEVDRRSNDPSQLLG